MLVTSRSAAEYRAMFDLDAAVPAGSVLDCCAGGSSFTAETAGRTVAVDPAYATGYAALATGLRERLQAGEQIIREHPDRFDWRWYGSPARRAAIRAEAAELFLADLRRRSGLYVAGALPRLPFADGAVDLVLCSHLLFTWADRFDEAWHRAALTELARVARHQVRVFPIVVQGTGEPVPFLDSLRVGLAAAGLTSAVRTVPYAFQRGGDAMLVVDR